MPSVDSLVDDWLDDGEELERLNELSLVEDSLVWLEDEEELLKLDELDSELASSGVSLQVAWQTIESRRLRILFASMLSLSSPISIS